MPDELNNALMASVHTALAIALSMRGVDLGQEELITEADAVCSAVEPFLEKALTQAASASPEGLPQYEDSPLNTVQTQCLWLYSRGDTLNQIAEKTGLTSHAANHRLERARDALGARNRPHLLAIAMREGWLGPSEASE